MLGSCSVPNFIKDISGWEGQRHACQLCDDVATSEPIVLQTLPFSLAPSLDRTTTIFFLEKVLRKPLFKQNASNKFVCHQNHNDDAPRFSTK